MGETEWRLKPSRSLQRCLAARISVVPVASRNEYRYSIVNVVKANAVFPWTIGSGEAGRDAIAGRYETQGT